MASVAIARGLDAVPAETQAPGEARLRLGVFADSLQQPRWVVEALAKIVACELAEIVLVVDLGRSRDPASPLLWRAYCSLDSRLFGSRPDPLERIDLRAAVPHGRLLRFPREPTGPASASAWLGEIRSLRLDVAFALGDVNDRPLDGVARYGVWRYCFGEDASRGDVLAGVREVAAFAPVTASGLRVRLSGDEGDRLAYQSWSRTFPLSVARTRDSLLPKTGEFARRALEELQRSGTRWLESLPRVAPADGPAALPGTATALRHLSLVGGRVARRAMQKALHIGQIDQWFLAYRFGRDDQWRGDLRRFTRVMPPTDRYWADPFPIVRDGRYFVFFEELVFSRGKAHIAVMEVSPDGRCSEPTPVLERDYHLSYPFLVEHEGELFMVPETRQNHTVELYRCTSFPDRWSLEHVLMQDVSCTDSTLHRAEDRWWMFANTCVVGAESGDELNLYYADRLTDPWRAHRGNPVKSDVRGARPAGRLYRRDGHLYRPAQIGVPRYGSGVSINRVSCLTPQAYEEQEVERVLPAHPLLGIHTVNRAGDLCVVDAFMRRSRLWPHVRDMNVLGGALA